MAAYNVLCLIIFIVICFNCTEAGVISGVYCRDPDTGTFHEPNTTWPSTTFCGMYSCKLRKKNNTEPEYKQENKNQLHSINNTPYNANKNLDMEVQSSQRIEQFRPEEDSGKNTVINPNDKDDRYLTEEEIKTISRLLHSVKKSDLDTIVEMYNLAQDIYKEMDAAPSDNLVEVAIDDIKRDNVMADPIARYPLPLTSASFWYEPINIYSSNSLRSKNSEASSDMKKSVSNQMMASHSVNDPPQEIPIANPRTIPYYYPMSSFQRLSSYVYNPYLQHRSATTVQSTDEVNTPPCKTAVSPNTVVAVTPWINRIVKKPFTMDATQKFYQSLLPYPFSYVHHYNLSSYPTDVYFDGRYWTRANGQYNAPFTYIRPGNAPITQILTSNNHPVPLANEIKQNANAVKLTLPNAAQDNGKSKLVQTLTNLSNKPVENKSGKDLLALWQTDPLPSQVINDVRAKIRQRSTNLLKSNPLIKQVKLEKVGKLIRLDEISRHKRDDQEVNKDLGSNKLPEDLLEVEYEPYLVKTMCDTPTELGFFRYGNNSAPFPECCPQKIESEKTNNVQQ